MSRYSPVCVDSVNSKWGSWSDCRDAQLSLTLRSPLSSEHFSDGAARSVTVDNIKWSNIEQIYISSSVFFFFHCYLDLYQFIPMQDRPSQACKLYTMIYWMVVKDTFELFWFQNLVVNAYTHARTQIAKALVISSLPTILCRNDDSNSYPICLGEKSTEPLYLLYTFPYYFDLDIHCIITLCCWYHLWYRRATSPVIQGYCKLLSL